MTPIEVLESSLLGHKMTGASQEAVNALQESIELLRKYQSKFSQDQEIDCESLLKLGFTKINDISHSFKDTFVLELHDVDASEGEWMNMEIKRGGGLDLRCWTLSINYYAPNGVVAAYPKEIELRHGLIYVRDIEVFVNWWNQLEYKYEPERTI